MPGQVRTEVHLGSAETAGAFCLLVDHPPPGWSLPAHLHRGVAETIHVIEGEFEMAVGGERFALTAGQTLHIPADVIHEGANVGERPGRRLLVFSPAGMERFFLDVGTESPDQAVDAQAALDSALRHGWEFTGGYSDRPASRRASAGS